MPRQQPPDQQQYQKGLNPDSLITDDEDSDDAEDSDQDELIIPPVEGDRQLAQDEREQRPADNIDQAEEEEADDDEDESDYISQRP